MSTFIATHGALILGLALAAIGTVVIHCIAALTDPEPDPAPHIAQGRAELLADPVLRLVVETEAVEAFLTLPVEIPSQRRESRWS